MKKLVSLITVLSLLGGFLLFPIYSSAEDSEFNSEISPFSDILNSEDVDALQYLKNSNIINGYSNGTFQPEKLINRAEFLKIILEANSNYTDICNTELKFPDVSKGDWYYNYVCYAVENSIVKGYEDGTFKPENNITFAEASKIISLSEQIKLEELIEKDWYDKYLYSLKRERVTPQTINSPETPISRLEMAKIIWGLKTGNEIENSSDKLSYLNSCSELNSQIENFKKRMNLEPNPYYYRGLEVGGDFLEEDMMVMESEASEEKISLGYSTTNIQEYGVDEADIIKNNGSHIYMIKGNTIRVIEANPTNKLAEVFAIGETDNSYFSPIEMFLTEDKLVVIAQKTNYTIYSEEEFMPTEKMIYPYPGNNMRTVVYLFDITDPNNISKEREISYDSNYMNSRVVNNHLYITTNKYINWYEGFQDQNFNLPEIQDSLNGELKVNCKDIIYRPNFDSANYLTVNSIDLKGNSKIKTKSILGSGEVLYSSPENFYIISTKSEYNERSENGRIYWSPSQYSNIYKFSLNDGDISYESSGKVPGRVLNQFSMSEYNGDFRIATQIGEVWDSNSLSETNIHILNEELNILSKIENIAPGEDMKSSRFVGNRAYLVTFKTVDPLFVIDLNPEQPKVLGKLKIPGWSDYLHPYDENHLIGFGKEVDESIDADKVHSDNAVYYTAVLGMKLSIFDVSDIENPIETHKLVIGDRGTSSEILYNHKALLFDKEKNLIAFPINVTENKNGKVGIDADIQTIFSGAHVYSVNLNDGFELKKAISHYEDDSIYLSSGEYFYGNWESNIQRIIYIGENLYTISMDKIKAFNLNTFEETNQLELN